MAFNEAKIKQLRRDIGIIRKQIGLSEDVYREMLYNGYQADSCTQLTEQQLKQLLNMLKKDGIKDGKYKPTKKYAFQKYKYDDLGHREGMASPRQLRKIEAMWFDVSKQTNDTDRENALINFLSKHFGIDAMKWVDDKMAAKLISTLNEMQKQKTRQYEKAGTKQ